MFIWFHNIIALIDGIIDLIQLQWLHEINYNLIIERLAAKMKVYLLYRTHLLNVVLHDYICWCKQGTSPVHAAVVIPVTELTNSAII